MAADDPKEVDLDDIVITGNGGGSVEGDGEETTSEHDSDPDTHRVVNDPHHSDMDRAAEDQQGNAQPPQLKPVDASEGKLIRLPRKSKL